MILYIDCEFNSYQGDLISLALVPSDDQRNSFYEVLDTSHLCIDQWVMENVMCKVGKAAICKEAFQARLQAYLDTFDAVHVVADWPEDLAWLCRSLITGPGTRIRYPKSFTMECRPVDAPSKNPHNALADAEGLRDFFNQY